MQACPSDNFCFPNEVWWQVQFAGRKKVWSLEKRSCEIDILKIRKTNLLGSPCCLERQQKLVVVILTQTPSPGQWDFLLQSSAAQALVWGKLWLDPTRKQFPQAIEKGKSRKTEDVYKDMALSMVLQWKPTKENVRTEITVSVDWRTRYSQGIIARGPLEREAEVVVGER